MIFIKKVTILPNTKVILNKPHEEFPNGQFTHNETNYQIVIINERYNTFYSHTKKKNTQ